MEGQDIWGGVPPAGKRPIKDRKVFLYGLIGVILFEWTLWLVYRYLSYPIIESAFSRLGFLFHIIAAPTLGLVPLVIYWKFIMKEEGIPWKFTSKHLFSSVIIGAVAASVLMLLYQLSNWFVLVVSGYGIPADTYFISLWQSADWDFFILMTFTFFFIVGPVEELQYRSFLQDQLGRVFKPSTGLLIASALFALSHLPIYFIVYKLDPIQAGFTLCWTFTMGSVLGVFYFQSRNIMGPIIMHGLWDWILSVYVIDIRVKESYMDIGYLGNILWLIALIPMALLTMVLINVFYEAIWKKDRPEGSFGIGPIGPFIGAVKKTGAYVKNTWVGKSLEFTDNKRTGTLRKTGRSILGVVIICLLVMLFSFPGKTIDLAGASGDASVEGSDEQVQETTISFDEGHYVNEGGSMDLTLEINESSVVTRVSVSLLWTEASDGRFWMVNEPDTFAIRLLSGDIELEGEEGDTGSLSFVWEDEGSNMTGEDIGIIIECLDAGDIHPRFIDLTNIRDEEDTGNDVTISVQLTYFEKE